MQNGRHFEKKAKDNINISLNSKYLLLLFFIFLPLLYLFVMLYKIQILHGKKYADIRNAQNTYSRNSYELRGDIYAERKDGVKVPMALMESIYLLTIVPRSISQDYKEVLYEKLNEVTEIDRENFLEKAGKKNDPYEEIKEITFEEKTKINEMLLEGVRVYETKKRFYPFGEIGARMVGFVGGGEDGFRGRYGLEKFYDGVLSAEAGKKVSFFSSLFDRLQREEDSQDLKNKDIITSIEPNVLVYLHKTLDQGVRLWSPELIGGVIMNVESGEIVAMDVLPSYDPNKYSEYESKLYTNPIVDGVYELGSIFKPITLSLGIDAGLITPQTHFRDPGQIKLNTYTIKNFDKKAHGDVSMQTVLTDSLNTGTVYVMRLLGMDDFGDGVAQFLIEELTGIDLPGEVLNKTKNLKSGVLVDSATAAFGQGIALTPISTLRALASLTSGGMLKNPHLVKAKVTLGGIEEKIVKESDNYESVKNDTAKTMEEMMVRVLDDGVDKGKYSNPNYKVGAKTGTAQIPKPGGGYFENKFLHSYFTFFGDEDKRFAILLFQVNPKTKEPSTKTLPPIADKMVDFMISYYNIAPNR